MAVCTFLHPGYTYVYTILTGLRDMLRARLYYNTCTPLLLHVPFLARPQFIVAACRQTDRPVCTYTFVTRQTTLHTLQPGGSQRFLACEDIAGGSQPPGGRIIFLPEVWTHFLACEDVAGGSQQSRRNVFFMKYGGPSVGPCCQVEESLFCT